MLFPVPPSLPPSFSSISFLFAASLCLLSWRSLCVWLQRKRSGFMVWWSNEKRRGDSAVSTQRPHLLSFLCSLYLSTSLFLLPLSLCLFIYWGCSLCLSTSECIYHLYCTNTHQRRWFWIVDFSIWLIVDGFVGLTAGWHTVLRREGVDGECHPVALQLKLQLKLQL